ncbi:hypothetical protein [Microcoleus sp. D2_18a_D3]|uniref:hypothetical protein n=1 Tax=Microcoleus sp. D2_18a_D3 TaxID=3055330 RepID=UPI002FD22B77
MTTKELLETIAVVVSIGGAAAAGGFAAAILRSEARIDRIISQIEDWHIFAGKAQKNISRNTVDIGLLQTECQDIKKVLKMQRRPPLPEENKPERTDFT